MSAVPRLVLSRGVFTRPWHPQVQPLARLRALYWFLIRNHKTEICSCCGRPVGIVFRVPDAIWERAAGFPGSNARFPDGEAAPGVLCPHCLDANFDALSPRGVYLTWTCRETDSRAAAGSAEPPAKPEEERVAWIRRWLEERRPAAAQQVDYAGLPLEVAVSLGLELLGYLDAAQEATGG